MLLRNNSNKEAQRKSTLKTQCLSGEPLQPLSLPEQLRIISKLSGDYIVVKQPTIDNKSCTIDLAHRLYLFFCLNRGDVIAFLAHLGVSPSG